MSRAIYSKLSDEFIIRMRNWALSSAGTTTQKLTAWYDEYVSPGEPESRVPILIGESEDTQKAFVTVEDRYRFCVAMFWQFEGKSMRWMSRKCRCDARTFEGRVITGHEQLKRAIYVQHDAIRRYRAAINAAPY